MTVPEPPLFYLCLCVRGRPSCSCTQGAAAESAWGREVMRPPSSWQERGRKVTGSYLPQLHKSAASCSGQASCSSHFHTVKLFLHATEKTLYPISPKFFPAKGLDSVNPKMGLTIWGSQRPGSGWERGKGGDRLSSPYPGFPPLPRLEPSDQAPKQPLSCFRVGLLPSPTLVLQGLSPPQPASTRGQVPGP